MQKRNSASSQWLFRGQATDFIGRARELHLLREAMRNVIEDGRQEVILLLADPGLGKSRLLAEFAHSLHEHIDGVSPLHLSCIQGALLESLPLQFLQQRFQIHPQDPPQRAKIRLRSGLQQLLGNEEGRRASTALSCFLGWEESGEERDLEAALDASALLLKADAKQRAQLILLDDLHLAQGEQLNLLSSLAERLKEIPLLCVAAARPEIRKHSRFLRLVQQEGSLLELSGFPDRAGERILRDLLKRLKEPPESFLKAVVEQAHGNPLRLEQLLELQMERGALETSTNLWKLQLDQVQSLGIQESLEDTIRAKLERLIPWERRVLERAAIIGEIFWAEAIEALLRAEAPETDSCWPKRSVELERMLSSLRQRRFILQLPTPLKGFKTFSFKHALERELLYSGLSSERRAQGHRWVAQWMASASQSQKQFAGLLAQHWSLGGCPERAAWAYRQAAERAEAGHVYGEARAAYQQALDSFPDTAWLERIDLHHALGRLALLRSDHPQAQTQLLKMRDLAWRLNDPRRGGLAHHKLGQSSRALGAYPEAQEHLKQAQVLFRQLEDIRGLAACADELGCIYRLMADYDQAETHIEEGLRLRRYLEDERGAALSLYHLGNITLERGRLDSAEALLVEALEGARTQADRRTEAEILNTLGVLYTLLERSEQASEAWQEALSIAQELELRQLQGTLYNNLGESLSREQPEEARGELEQAVNLFQETRDRRGLTEAYRNLGRVHLQLGDFQRARQEVHSSLKEAQGMGSQSLEAQAERSLGEIYAQTLFSDLEQVEDRADQAAQHFERAVQLFDAMGQEAELGRSLLIQGAFLAEAGRIEIARAQLQSAQRLFERLKMEEALKRCARILEAL